MSGRQILEKSFIEILSSLEARAVDELDKKLLIDTV